MVEVPPGLAIASPFLAFFALFLTVRLGIIDGRLEGLTTRTENLAQNSLGHLAAHLRRRRPDPQITENLASEYCGLTQRVAELARYDSVNWVLIGLDILGLILCLVYSFIPPTPVWDSIETAVFTVLLLVFVCCMFFFIHSIAYIRRTRRRLDAAETNHQP